ncbi:MAG: hypothetical protein VCA34_09395, partial [Roseibacillus sp.]
MIQIPEHAPFTEGEPEAMSKMAAGCRAEQRLWLSSFLAGASAVGRGRCPAAEMWKWLEEGAHFYVCG